ncbi:MAG: hypothetical protein ABIE55_02495, partial [Candidatus Aenigmatarchaeota archaeon]
LDKMEGKKLMFPTFTPKIPKSTRVVEKNKMPVNFILAIILIAIAFYFIFSYNKEILGFISRIQCEPNFVKAYESGASFGREPFTYCKNTCIDDYNSTVYNLIEPNETSKVTVCFCDVNNCNP